MTEFLFLERETSGRIHRLLMKTLAKRSLARERIVIGATIFRPRIFSLTSVGRVTTPQDRKRKSELLWIKEVLGQKRILKMNFLAFEVEFLEVYMMKL